MMFRRRILEEIGGFDPDLGPGAPFYGEEMDAQVRASVAGWWGLYNPDVIVAHHHRRKAEDIPALMRNYSVGTGAYTAKCLLLAETRHVALPVVTRNWYWLARKAVRRSANGVGSCWSYRVLSAISHIVCANALPAGGTFLRKKTALRCSIKDNPESVPTTVSTPLAQKPMLLHVAPILRVRTETGYKCFDRRDSTAALKGRLIKRVHKIACEFLASACRLKHSP